MRLLTTLAVASLAVSPLATATGAHAATHAASACDGIAKMNESLTAKFLGLRGPAQSITVVNAPLLIVGQGPLPRVITGLTDLVSTLQVDTAGLAATGPCDEAAAKDTVAGVEKLTAAANETLNILVGKAPVVQVVPTTAAPLAQSLKQIESALDTYLFKLADLNPTEQDGIRTLATSVQKTLQTAIDAYQNPSPA